VFAFTFRDGVIVGIDLIADPDRLARFSIEFITMEANEQRNPIARACSPYCVCYFPQSHSVGGNRRAPVILTGRPFSA
jgi:hypothetical protein